MKRAHRLLCMIALGLLATAIGGCASKPKAVPAPQETTSAEAGKAGAGKPEAGKPDFGDADAGSIQAEAKGLAPAGDPRFQRMRFAISFGDTASLPQPEAQSRDRARNGQPGP